jgi:hypothetical protein
VLERPSFYARFTYIENASPNEPLIVEDIDATRRAV